jgi:hypothetical protein
VPADAAAVFFGSLREAEDAVGGLAGFLPRALPGLCGEPAEGRRDALRRAVDGLLLPTIWRSNPGVRTGTRQVAIVVSDPDVRWAPEIALLCEVDDAGLVRFHRQSTISWEDRSPRRLRVEGLDVAADDGSVRSRFALEGGIALWSTTRALRERILAAGAGRAPSLLSPPAAAYGLARRTFPPAGGGALLVVPDAFLARNGAPGVRARRAAALRCEAARLLLDARSVAGGKVSSTDTIALACPSGGALAAVPGGCGSSCAVHGTAAWPAPLGDLPEAASPEGARVPADALAEGAVPVAARWDGEVLDLLVPPGAAGERLLAALGTWATGVVEPGVPSDRLPALESRFPGRDRPGAEFLRLAGLAPSEDPPFSGATVLLRPPAPRPEGGVLRVSWKAGGTTGPGGAMAGTFEATAGWR